MTWEIIFSVVATIFSGGGIGAGIKGILLSNKTKKDFITSEKINQEALHKIELKLTEISAKVDLVIKFTNDNKNTNKNEITFNESIKKKGRKNCE